jgi:hypothetical protein
LSYVAGIGTTIASGGTTIDIDSSGNPDNDTDHLFPKDNVCFAPSSLSGCKDNKDYVVSSITDSDTFIITEALGSSLAADDLAISTSSGTMSLTFTIGADVPVNGDIYITVPARDADNVTDDCFPDYTSATSTNGFDLCNITTSNVSIVTNSGTCPQGDWTVAAVAAGSSVNDHTIRIDRATSTCQSGANLTVQIGDGTNELINPAPVTSGHTQGQADVYSINLKTRNPSDATIEQVNMLAAPVEAVLISATVEETFSFRVCGVDTDLSTVEGGCFTTPGTVCNQASLNVGSTATSVPFGTLSTADSFYNAAQYLVTATNADSGYVVTIQQNDQMGKDGVTCTGNPTDPAATNCIPDNPGDSTLDYNNSDDCDTAATNGLCFSQDDGPTSGSPTFAVKWDTTSDDCDGSPTFCARSAADQENGPESPQSIISNTNPVSTNDAFVCWRLSIDGIQPAGYYYNKVKYVATPRF